MASSPSRTPRKIDEFPELLRKNLTEASEMNMFLPKLVASKSFSRNEVLDWSTSIPTLTLRKKQLIKLCQHHAVESARRIRLSMRPDSAPSRIQILGLKYTCGLPPPLHSKLSTEVHILPARYDHLMSDHVVLFGEGTAVGGFRSDSTVTHEEAFLMEFAELNQLNASDLVNEISACADVCVLTNLVRSCKMMLRERNGYPFQYEKSNTEKVPEDIIKTSTDGVVSPHPVNVIRYSDVLKFENPALPYERTALLKFFSKLYAGMAAAVFIDRVKGQEKTIVSAVNWETSAAFGHSGMVLTVLAMAASAAGVSDLIFHNVPSGTHISINAGRDLLAKAKENEYTLNDILLAICEDDFKLKSAPTSPAAKEFTLWGASSFQPSPRALHVPLSTLVVTRKGSAEMLVSPRVTLLTDRSERSQLARRQSLQVLSASPRKM